MTVAQRAATRHAEGRMMHFGLAGCEPLNEDDFFYRKGTMTWATQSPGHQLRETLD